MVLRIGEECPLVGMDKQEIIDLTNKIYKLTLLFPKKEPLRYKIREKADEILENFIVLDNRNSKNDLIFELKNDLEVLDSYFEVAKWQNWVSYFDVLAIQENYAKMGDNLKTEGEEKSLKIEFPAKVSEEQFSADKTLVANNKLDSRKERILEVLKEMGRVQVYQVKEIFPEVSKRTLRRDFEKLLKQGLVERIGERNETFYQLAV
ncbi:MAG: DeoR family transcriptional regulator [Candidatus Nealsonbacteria bacterium]|nr:DeoR family transcriptional regulator [Candidatus Nealsonbacteria bacterium]